MQLFGHGYVGAMLRFLSTRSKFAISAAQQAYANLVYIPYSYIVTGSNHHPPSPYRRLWWLWRWWCSWAFLGMLRMHAPYIAHTFQVFVLGFLGMLRMHAPYIAHAFQVFVLGFLRPFQLLYIPVVSWLPGFPLGSWGPFNFTIYSRSFMVAWVPLSSIYISLGFLGPVVSWWSGLFRLIHPCTDTPCYMF